MALNSYFTQGTSGEQNLTEDLIIEQIKMFGKNVYYVPRTLVKEDNVFTEDTMSTFDGAYEMEVYVEDAGGFRGDGDVFSKFGVRISDQVTFIVSRKRFTEAVDNNAQLIVEGRPNEGDLVWFPLAGKMFEIQFVEHETPFYQLGKQYVWGLRCELFEYSDENFDTGVQEIDEIETVFANTIALTMNEDPAPVGTFQADEEVTGGNSNVNATVKSWDAENRILLVYNRTGTFRSGETVTGQTSGAVATTLSYNTINNVNSEYDQNFAIETVADGIIDFTESNPFGEFGNKSGTL